MSLELDHVFVSASVDAPEIELIREAGFIEGSTHDHPGQGTASRGIFFENAYLELIWLTDPAVAAAPPITRTGLATRADPLQGASPFGFGLRSTQDPVPPLPFDTWDYMPPYLPRGSAFRMAANSKVLNEPLIFLLPWSRAPSWDVPDHPCGARRITKVRFGPCSDAPSAVIQGFLDLGLVSCTKTHGPLLQVQLDDGIKGDRCDLRPGLPLVVDW